MSQTRGIRNNNPLNIRKGSMWKGLVLNGDDPEFSQFITMEYGLRAGMYLLRKYILTYGCDTVASIISRWAPPRENNTEAYINYVATHIGADPNEPLNADVGTIFSLVVTMCQMESGFKPSYKQLEDAWNLL